MNNVDHVTMRGVISSSYAKDTQSGLSKPRNVRLKPSSRAVIGLRHSSKPHHVHNSPLIQRRQPICTAVASRPGKQEEVGHSHGSIKTKLPPVLLTLALTGATTGTFLDGIHSRAGVLVYDQLPFQLGGLFSSVWVPPLLACFYVVLGASIILIDLGLMDKDPTTRMGMKNAGLARMALSFGTLAAMLWLSAYLYMQGYDSSTICSILAGCAAVNYLVFDSTKQGMLLAVICAIGAPAAELVLMGLLHLWHYPAADFYPDISGGLLRWIPFCYFFYVPAVANLSRYLWKVL